jgi:formylglycine-generating enzyme required for sulfatase activity
MAYIKKGEDVVAAKPLGRGYRLPTEAEWEYCARFAKNQAPLKYPWGNTFPPETRAGNYADVSAKGLLSGYLKDYHDGYPVSAPTESFPPNDLGVFDLGGNVAEWCHDYYAMYSFDDNKIYLDPAGPGQGNHHVVRGSGWKHASIGTLRLSYRDYSNDKRLDLGFRVCRYAE